MAQLVVRRGPVHPRDDLLDVPLEGDAELEVGVAAAGAVWLGAFQRAAEVQHEAGVPFARRSSGGHAVRVDPGSLVVRLALARCDVLEPDADAPRLVNRHVRPLLRALGRTGARAAYFGRDWISIGSRPGGFAGLGHDASTGRAVFEAIVAIATPFALEDRPSFRHKAQVTLEDLALSTRSLVDDVVEAYRGAWQVEVITGPARASSQAARGEDPPWVVTVEQPCGRVGAGPDVAGVLRLGGELLASRDAVERAPREGAEAAFARAGVVLEGAMPGALDALMAQA